MTLRMSTGLRNYIQDSGINGAFDTDGRINIYTGSQPADADADVTGTLLATLSMSADGIVAASGGTSAWATITGDVSADATGTAGWFRIYKSADGVGGVSTTKRRIDGAITGTGGGGQIEFDNTSFVATGTVGISSLSFSAANWA